MKIFILSLVMLSVIMLQAQDRMKNLELGYGFGKASVFQKGLLQEPTGFYDKHYDTYALTYNQKLSSILTLYTGFSWLKTTLKSISPPDYEAIKADNLDLLYVPLGIKVTVFKYFFVKGNASIAFDISNRSPLSNQTGIGGGMAVGMQYVFKNRIGVSISPYFNQHGIILFNRGLSHEKLMESGFQVGLNYHF